MTAIPHNSATETAPSPEASQSLLERARHDPVEFGRLYRMHYRAIAGYLLRRTGSAEVAEDLAGETFLHAWRAMPRYRDRGRPFRAWLIAIASNEANRWSRKRKRNHAALESEPEARPATASGESVAQRALLSLAEAHQTVLVLHHVEGMSIEEIARALGCREGTVKSRLARARAAMRRSLEHLGYTHA